MTAPYPYYFVFVPREASNLSEVKIWGCCCPETVFGAHRKNSYKFSAYLLDLQFLVHMPQIISKLSLAEHFFI
jgi:hypothetical protein